LLNQYTGTLNMASAFVCVFTLTGLGYFIFRGMEALDRYIVFWTDRDRVERVGRLRAAKWQGITQEAFA
jgi:NitT/TauT family transport system permease protein